MKLRVSPGVKISTLLLSLLVFCCSFFVILISSAQESTRNNRTGSWTNNAMWTDNSAVALTNINGVHIAINGYVSAGSFGANVNVTFSNDNSAHNFTVNDTLVIYGNVNFANKAMNLVIPAGGVMIVLGNFSSDNKIDLSNGGILVVSGTATFGGAQSDYNDNGGEFWPIGGTSGNPDAQTAYNNSGPFLTNAPGNLINFVNNAGQFSLPIKLLDFRVSILEDEKQVLIEWATEKEDNFNYFEIERAGNDGKFSAIGEEKGAGYNTSSIQKYSWVDNNPLIGTNYYRLRAVDLDGTSETFRSAFVNFSDRKRFSVFPNPANASEMKYRINFEYTSGDKIVLLNRLGDVLLDGFVSGNEANLPFSDDVEPGIYFLKYSSSSFNEVVKIIVR